MPGKRTGRLQVPNLDQATGGANQIATAGRTWSVPGMTHCNLSNGKELPLFPGAASVMNSSEKAAAEAPARPSGQRREQVIIAAAFSVPVVLVTAGWLYLLSQLLAMIYDWLLQ